MSKAQDLRALLAEDTCHVMPCCWDALSAKMIAQAGFKFTFMSGFAVSAWRIGQPDVGLISYGEMLDQGRNICAAAGIPVIGDADTGYGNALNVERTVMGYAQAGFASVMIEDQVWPKRCGHTRGKRVVERDEAFDRIKAATYARDASESDILILARTDARAVMIWMRRSRGQRGMPIWAPISFLLKRRKTKTKWPECAVRCREFTWPIWLRVGRRQFCRRNDCMRWATVLQLIP